jgi:hypothetical protein
MKFINCFKQFFIWLILVLGIQMNVQAYTCPDAFNYYCSNDPVIILQDLGDLPAGIFYLQNQQTVTQIVPSNYPKGAEILIHFVNSSPAFRFLCDFSIIIHAVPEVTCPKLLSFCWSLNTIDFGSDERFQPKGGTFSGDHITATGIFDLENAGPGNHVIKYSIVNANNGCSNVCQTTISVVNGEISNCPANGIFVCYKESIDLASLANIQPSGGVYLGDYIANNILSAPTPGTYDITYLYERIQGCDGICEFKITLYPLPDFECPDDILICGLGGGTTELPFPRQYGWTYQGNGVSVSNGIPLFDPLKAGKGKHKITLTIFNDFKCEKVCVFYITVSDISVECPRMLEVCANEKTDLTMLWNFNPKGIFVGEMVSSGGIFTAPLVYEPICSKVKYTLKDEFGCIDSCQFLVCIIPYPRIECPDTLEACQGDTTLVLIPNEPGGHFYLKDKEIPNILNIENFVAGTYEITYVYVISENPYCTFTCRFVLIIYPKPHYECPNDTVVCLNDELVELPIPPFRHWTYIGRGASIINGRPVFDPSKVGVGEYTITITVVDENGCTTICEFTIKVIEYHVTCPKEIWVCTDTETNLLTKWNFDPRGTFSGKYVSSEGVFDAPLIYKNECFPVTYTSTNEAGCKDSCTFNVCVFAAPNFVCPDTVFLCIDNGIYLPSIGFKYRFYWNGNEIPNGFDPIKAGIGTHVVKIVIVDDNELKCSYTCEFVIVVVPKPKWECPDDMTLCSADQVIELPKLPYPEYYYRGTGVFTHGGTSYFSAPKSGKYTITISITDKNGCSGTCSFIISVGEFRLECPKEIKVCPDVKNDLTKLWNFDPRGEFFGDWVTKDGIFIAPYIAGKNNCYLLKYRIVIDDNCKDSCRFMVCVNNVPTKVCPDTMEVCIDEKPFNPAIGTNATVYFQGVPIPNGFNPASAGPGAHTLIFEFPNDQSDCKSYCQMVIIVHPLPEIDCPDDIYICKPETSVVLPVFDYPYIEYKGNGIYYEKKIAHFKAPNGRPGTYTIWLYIKDQYGCTNSCSFNIIVGDVDVSCPEVLTVCPEVTTNLTTLWNFNHSGVFTGPFTNADGLFDAPGVTGQAECYPIMFTLKTADGCVDSCEFKVCVLPLPKIKCPDTIHSCINDNPFNPMPGAPGTIYFNGKPIPNGFSPQEAGVGTHFLSYVYRFSERPECEYQCKFVIIVHPLPEIECPNNMLVCSTDQKVELPKPTYVDYFYEGDGVTFESGIYYFNSGIAGTGTHVIMLVVYNEYGCKNICRFNIFVGETKIDCPDTLWVCAGEKEDLNRLWNFPFNGTFSGPGVNSEGIFFSDEIIERQCIDIYYHYYKYKCKDSCHFTVCIEPLPDVECPDTIHVCKNGTPFVPIANASGIFYFKGEPLPNGYFNPIAYSPGSYIVTYVETYGHNRECRFTCDVVIVIHSRIQFECPQDILICDTKIKMIELPDLPYPYFEYTGDYVGGDVGSQFFMVSDAGMGIHYISVTVKDEWGCTASCRFRIIVGGGSIVCPDTLYLCSGEKYPISRLFPGGGYFISNMVFDNWFIAPVAAVDKCYDIKYVLKDKYGCVDSCIFVICVQGKKVVECPDTIRVCENGQAFIPDINQSGGEFILNGEVLEGGLFDPSNYGPGFYSITYHYITAAPYFCDLRCSFVIQVLSKPKIECPKEIRLCLGDDPLVLSGLIWPQGGKYTFNGAVITTFYPKEPGKYVIVYTYTDKETGCTSTCELVIWVNPLPKVQCPDDFSICAAKGVFELGGGEPVGGQYHENGSVITHIHTDLPGIHTIWYVFSDRYTGCTDSCSFNIYILAKPQVDCPEKITVCSEDKLNLLDYVAKPTSEMYHYGFTGQGLSGPHNEIFEPNTLSQGEYLITYTVEVGNCVDSCSFWVIVIRPPVELYCPDDMVLCTTAGIINISALLSPTGAPMNVVVTGQYLTLNIPDGSVTFNPSDVDQRDYNKPIEITATSCTYYNNGTDSCCSSCTFNITVTNKTNVECSGNIFACEGTGSIDLLNYVSPDGGEFYRNGNLVGSNLSLVNLPTLVDIRIIYYFPQRGVDCTDSCTLTLKVLPKPIIDLRDTIWNSDTPLFINNNKSSYSTSYYWTTEGDGTFNNPLLLHTTYNEGIADYKKGKVVLHLRAANESCESKGSMVAFAAQQVPFPAGWSGVSIYRDPVDNNLEKIVEPIREDLNLIFNFDGDNYIPLKSILTNWNNQSGYIANCTDGSLLLVTGSYTSGLPLYVHKGWNLIPVLSNCMVNIGVLSLNNNLKMAKEIAGLNVYWPDANVFDLTQLEPGKAYMADFISSETIILPECGTEVMTPYKSSANDPFIPEAWGELHKTPISFVIALPLEQFAGEKITEGDIIGAFTPEGILGGICEIGLNNSLVLFGNDPLTIEKDGFDIGDPITLKLYKQGEGDYYRFDPTNISGGSMDGFEENGSVKIEEVMLTDVNSVKNSNFLIYPNPVNHILNIFNPIGPVSCTVYNTTGQVLIRQQLENGINKLTVQSLRGGIYIIQFNDFNIRIAKRFIKQ